MAWLNQKTEEPKRNKGNFTFPTYTTVNVIELQSNKKSGNTPYFNINSPFSVLSPISSKKILLEISSKN